MESIEILGYVITMLLGYVGYNGQQLIKKMERFERKMEEVIIASIGDRKDIDVLRRDVDNHDVRITKLEK